MVAKKNIIEGAAHGSSGASELKTRKAGLLTSAKKTISTLSLVCAIFSTPVAFSDDGLSPLVDTNQTVQVLIETFSGTSFGNTKTINTTLSFLPFVYFSNDFGVRLTVADGKWSVTQPTIAINSSSANNPGTTGSYNARPVKIGDYYYPYRYFPSVCAIYRLVEIAYQSNISPSAFKETASVSAARYCNVSLTKLISEGLTSTNGQYRATVVGLLSGIYSELQSFRSDFSEVGAVNYEILETLQNIEKSYSNVHYFNVMSFTNSIDFALSSGYINQTEHDNRLREYNALSSDPAAQNQYAQGFKEYFDTLRGVNDSILALLNNDDTSELGDKLNEGLNNSIQGGFSASAHVQGATTNLLQKMTNLTDQIKKDLDAWRTDATNRLERQWHGIKSVETNTHETANGVARIVNDGVRINGPVEVTIGTDNLHVDIANTDLDSLINGFVDGSDSAMQRWLDEWEFFKQDQLPYMDRFSSFIRSNTNLLSSIEKRLDFGFTNTLDATYAFLTNGLESAISNGVSGIGLNLTNELWDYYFDRFQKANEFRDDDGQLFSSIDNQRQLVFGNGFDDAEYKKLDWFSRVELLLYQIGYASTNGTESIDSSDLEGEFDDVSDEIQTAASAFEGAARRVVGVFSLVGGFAQAIKNAFSDIAAPSTDGILLLEGGSWIVEEPLYLRVPVLIQNALRLVFQCVWYLSAFVIGWRLVSFAWGRVSSLVRWLWSLIDV